ncbi:transposase [Flavobacterium sp. CG_9.1]|uniref:helix-turn-helix domain-containing protein n=1 Tax=Flavobacterium sp. CG_9.1 TaxID=2787728 RepID=UPI0018CB9D1F|nr:helix-turn-helix domain-containing protein [Flavobacterium sp. CG_9.1]MBG6062326.1 transposase [Flavobacterium sp. CG_9.1]
MPKKISITIEENIDFLEKSYSKAQGSLKQDRIKTLIYIKTKQYFFQSEIAKKLGRTEKTIRDWIQSYSRDGFSGLTTVRSGGNNTKTISDAMILLIEKKVTNSSTTITSYVELKLLLEEELKEEIDYGALYSHCRRKFKSKLKVARKSHYKKDENAEAFFKKPKKQT